MRRQHVLVVTAAFGLACLGGRREDVPAVCLEAISCMEERDPTSAPSVAAAYGEESECWDNPDDAALCENACIESLLYCESLPDPDSDGPTEDCTNDDDDDGDLRVDCHDPDCEFADACIESECDDGRDNDGDGDPDCEDRDCNGISGC
jgi:hypothetical protein